MSRVRVKICGITSLTDLKIAVNAGADAIGVIVDVPTSPRNVSIHQARTIIEATPLFTEAIAVTVPKDLNSLERLAKALNPPIIQVHGFTHLNGDIRERLPDARLIGTVHAKSNQVIHTARKAANIFDALLLDSYSPDQLGGTGKVHNWELSKAIRDAIHPTPLILAGGLTPDNVHDAIRTVNPYAVDVSTGVEAQPGVKDPHKVSQFIKNAKDAQTP